MKSVFKLLKDKSGATAIEYALIATLISVAAIGGYGALGGKLQTSFNNTADTVGSAL
jgi:pilus assembly protein Flp/PilA